MKAPGNGGRNGTISDDKIYCGGGNENERTSGRRQLMFLHKEDDDFMALMLNFHELLGGKVRHISGFKGIKSAPRCWW